MPAHPLRRRTADEWRGHNPFTLAGLGWPTLVGSEPTVSTVRTGTIPRPHPGRPSRCSLISGRNGTITAILLGIACCFVAGCVVEWLGRPRSPVASRSAAEAHQTRVSALQPRRGDLGRNPSRAATRRVLSTNGG